MSFVRINYYLLARDFLVYWLKTVARGLKVQFVFPVRQYRYGIYATRRMAYFQ